MLLTDKHFVFPVYGKHDYADAFTGIHYQRISAPAAQDRTRRRHLRRSGHAPRDSFFYAHLSAFATDTRNGLQVKAGQVIGFLGSTGDAEHTPPHLHFEVHPGDGAAVDPYPFLRAWESRRDVPAAAWVRENGQVGQQPGTLVVLKDFLSR